MKDKDLRIKRNRGKRRDRNVLVVAGKLQSTRARTGKKYITWYIISHFILDIKSHHCQICLVGFLGSNESLAYLYPALSKCITLLYFKYVLQLFTVNCCQKINVKMYRNLLLCGFDKYMGLHGTVLSKLIQQGEFKTRLKYLDYVYSIYLKIH